MVRLEKNTLVTMRDPSLMYDFINVLIKLRDAQIDFIKKMGLDVVDLLRMVEINQLPITRYELKDYFLKKEVNEKVILSISSIIKENEIIINHFSQLSKKYKTQ